MKIIVSHPEQQHSFKLATALKEKGYLNKYITTVYYKPKNLTFYVSKILKGDQKIKAESRHCDDLENQDVVQFSEFLGILKLFVMRYSFTRHFYERFRDFTADIFARKVATYAVKNNVDAVVTYDTCSPVLFEILKKKAPHIDRIMDMSAANLLYMRQIYDYDIEITPSFADQLKKEKLIVWNERSLRRVKKEITDTQYFLVPSDFVKRSLSFSGVTDEQMLYVPYGVDVDKFTPKHYKTIESRPIEFIYVGGVNEFKGISYLLEAFKTIPSNEARLTIVGGYSFLNRNNWISDNIRFTGKVLHDEVAKLLKEADVFVFPSLGDSYSLAAMEAAACGLPLIVTENTGMSDQMVDGQEGFVIPIQSVEAIKEKVTWFISNKDAIIQMGINARKMAERNTWDRYSSSARRAFEHIASINSN